MRPLLGTPLLGTPLLGTPLLGTLLLGTLGVLIITLTSGCITPYRALSIETGDLAHNKPYQQERDGLVLAATLIDDSTASEELFYHPLPERNVIPVVLHLENHGDQSMTFRLEQVRLVLENGVELQPVDASEVIAESRQSMFSAYVGLPLVVPYFVVRQEIAEFNFRLTEDYRKKALPGFLRVTPRDDPSARVLFFRIDEESLPAIERSPVLQVPVDYESLSRPEGGVIPGKREFFHLALG